MLWASLVLYLAFIGISVKLFESPIADYKITFICINSIIFYLMFRQAKHQSKMRDYGGNLTETAMDLYCKILGTEISVYESDLKSPVDENPNEQQLIIGPKIIREHFQKIDERNKRTGASFNFIFGEIVLVIMIAAFIISSLSVFY
jgi:hypothetical protein